MTAEEDQVFRDLMIHLRKIEIGVHELLDALQTIANGDYDNAHDPLAAAKIARAVIEKVTGKDGES